MRDEPSRPFNDDTLVLSAVLVPEGEDDILPFGPDTLRVPALIIPEGSDAVPPYPYVWFGKVNLPAGWGAAAGSTRSRQDGADDWATGGADRASPPGGSDDQSGGRPAGGRPVPALAHGYSDPMARAVAAWRSLSYARRKTIVSIAAQQQSERPPGVERFFTNQAIYEEMARRLDTKAEFLMALSSWESGWLDEHSQALHNLFGVTHGGANDLTFASYAEAADYWVAHFGPYVRGARTMDEFVAGLRRAHYNSRTPDYYNRVKKQLATIRKYLNVGKAE